MMKLLPIAIMVQRKSENFLKIGNGKHVAKMAVNKPLAVRAKSVRIGSVEFCDLLATSSFFSEKVF